MKRTTFLLSVSVALACARVAHADEPDKTDQARAEFVRGVDLAGKGLWGEALTAFELSSKLRPHALTTYNVATCQRALAGYTRARATYGQALEEDSKAGGTELPASYADEARAHRAEIDALLAHIDVTLEPADAAISVDGRPVVPDGESNALVAGVAGAGPAAPPPVARFELLADPGVHLITLGRKGFAAVVLTRTFAPASHTALDLTMDRLPAIIRVSSPQAGAVVRLDGHDVGVAPIETTRPAGSHALEVLATGFVPYRANLVLLPGEEANLRTPLSPHPPPVTHRWWFWTGLGALVATAVGVGIGVFFATRTAPPPDGGGLGWVAPAR